MSLTINRKIFDQVATVIAGSGRAKILYWAQTEYSTTAESIDDIRRLPLLTNCRITIYIDGLAFYLAVPAEIVRATKIYDLPENEVQEPSLLGTTLLLDSAEDKYELGKSPLSFFSLMDWPLGDQNAYEAAQTNTDSS